MEYQPGAMASAVREDTGCKKQKVIGNRACLKEIFPHLHSKPINRANPISSRQLGKKDAITKMSLDAANLRWLYKCVMSLLGICFIK